MRISMQTPSFVKALVVGLISLFYFFEEEEEKMPSQGEFFVVLFDETQLTDFMVSHELKYCRQITEDSEEPSRTRHEDFRNHLLCLLLKLSCCN